MLITPQRPPRQGTRRRRLFSLLVAVDARPTTHALYVHGRADCLFLHVVEGGDAVRAKQFCRTPESLLHFLLYFSEIRVCVAGYLLVHRRAGTACRVSSDAPLPPSRTPPVPVASSAKKAGVCFAAGMPRAAACARCSRACSMTRSDLTLTCGSGLIITRAAP